MWIGQFGTFSPIASPQRSGVVPRDEALLLVCPTRSTCFHWIRPCIPRRSFNSPARPKQPWSLIVSWPNPHPGSILHQTRSLRQVSSKALTVGRHPLPCAAGPTHWTSSNSVNSRSAHPMVFRNTLTDSILRQLDYDPVFAEPLNGMSLNSDVNVYPPLLLGSECH